MARVAKLEVAHGDLADKVETVDSKVTAVGSSMDLQFSQVMAALQNLAKEDKKRPASAVQPSS
eukprot:2550628-Amphidinium_carterae.1